MSETKESTDTSLPSYEEALPPGQDIFQPTTLVLAGQAIHALTVDSPPLAIARRTKQGRLGSRTPYYDLKHMNSASGGYERLPADSSRYYIQRASRRLPDPPALRIKKSRSLIPGKAAHSTALPVDVSGKNSKHGVPNFYKDGLAVYANNGREWTDAQGNAVAVMHDDKTDRQHSLIVTAALPRGQFDMLVALWCCHVWEYGVANGTTLHEEGNFLGLGLLDPVCPRFSRVADF
ncbi:hypothetical protein S40288_10641 [Stachybotrys chartarum IBT 40288]|nr:hypothetical protein S40288_10641 [Stachybotrys chartarum IBT 40288]